MAVVTRTVETVNSFSFVNIIIAAPLFYPCFLLLWIVLSNLMFCLLSMTTVVISAEGASAISIVVLMVLRSLLFIATVAVLFVTYTLFQKFNILVRRQDRHLYTRYINILNSKMEVGNTKM